MLLSIWVYWIGCDIEGKGLDGWLGCRDGVRYWEVWVRFLNILDRARDLSSYQMPVL